MTPRVLPLVGTATVLALTVALFVAAPPGPLDRAAAFPGSRPGVPGALALGTGALPPAPPQLAANPAGWAPGAFTLAPSTAARIRAEAEKAVRRDPRPVERLASAGSDDADDADVVASREAFVDADSALLLALAWRAWGDARHLSGALDRLRAWARTYEPTGHPIDEARLAALVNAYVLVGGELAAEDDADVRAWLTTMRDRKRAWDFGERSAVNNHRTHQLALLLLLDRALGDGAGFAEDQAAAAAHAARNLDAETGESVDLRERGALYYHTYNLDAWLEIALLTPCCDAPITAAYQLLARRLAAGEVDGEFAGSASPLDAARGRNGFGYGAPGSRFDPRRAEHAVLTFAAFEQARGGSTATAAVPTIPTADTVERRHLYTLARYESWLR